MGTVNKWLGWEWQGLKYHISFHFRISRQVAGLLNPGPECQEKKKNGFTQYCQHKNFHLFSTIYTFREDLEFYVASVFVCWQMSLPALSVYE